MKAIKLVAVSIRSQRAALHAIFDEIGPSANARMAAAMFDSLIAEVERCTAVMESDRWLSLARGSNDVLVDEDKLEALLGQQFVRDVQSLQDLGSMVVNQLVSAADEITDEARASLGLPKLKRTSSVFSKPDEEKVPKRVPRNESKVEVLAHGREYVGTALRDYACALESMLESLQNMLLGAALLHFGGSMPLVATPPAGK